MKDSGVRLRVGLGLARLALAFALVLGVHLGGRELAPTRAQAAPVHPYIQGYVLGQGSLSGACNPSLSCSVASLVSSGAVSGTSGTFTGVVTAGEGSVGAPSHSFAGTGSDDGMYHTADVLRFATEGILRLSVSSIGVASTVTVSSASFLASSGSGGNAFAASTNGARFDFGGGATDYATSDGTSVTFAGPLKSAATQTRGTITLAAGTGTATVIAGAVCVCGSTTPNHVGCAVASTTLTATGTGTDVISYLCL